MSRKKDYYEILGISKTADASAIKKAYRKLAKKYHPDTNEGNAETEQKFKEVTEAYHILSDSEKRKLYDQYGHAAFDGTGAEADGFRQNAWNGQSSWSGDRAWTGQSGWGGQGTWGSGFSSADGQNGNFRTYHFEGSDADMDDILGSMFGGAFGHQSKRKTKYTGTAGSSRQGFWEQAGDRKGSDISAEIEVGFDEAAFGGKRMINLTGETGSRSLEVTIPAGIEDGKTIRLRGQGNPGIGGGKAGDLLLKIRVAEKAGYERKGADVYNFVKIPYTTAVFGGEVPIETLKGKVICKIKPGTQSGTKIRLRGKGIVRMNRPDAFGDQYTTVEIDVPRKLSREAGEKLKEYAKAAGMTA